MNTARLAAKVSAQNAVNAAVRLTAPAYFAALLPFLGQKIRKADGSFTKKFREALPMGKMGDYFTNSDYNLVRVLRESRDVQGQSGCEYREAFLYIAQLDNGVLTEFYGFNPNDFRSDFSVEKLVAARQAVEDARCTLSQAQSELSGFGEYDN